MSVLTAGASTNTDGLAQVAAKDVATGKEYVYDYGAPKLAFAFIPDSLITGAIEAWLAITDVSFRVTGVSVDTETGHIFIRGIPTAINEAGLSPAAILAIIGGFFALLGIAVSLRFVYQVGTSTGGGTTPVIDPCSQPGIMATIDCFAKKSAWVGIGIFVGLAVGAIVILVFVGKNLKP